jgi:CRISPR-associated protein Csy3
MELGNQLIYRKSISTGLAVFYSVDCNGTYKPLEIEVRKALGQKDGFTEAFNKKFELKAGVTKHDLAAGNPHSYEYCFVPIDSECIACKFAVRFEANSLSPERYQLAETTKLLEKFSALYNSIGGYQYLATRYLKSIYSGLWLWRNQQTDKTCISIKTSAGQQLLLENVQMRRYTDDWQEYQAQIDQIATNIAAAFVEPSKYFSLEVEAKLYIQPGLSVYPSQAFIESGQNNGRILQSTMVNGVRAAILSADKVGAAIATIDDWYPDADHPVRVGSYAADKNKSTCYRHPESGLDLYTLLSGLENTVVKLANLNKVDEIPNEAHFIVANLIKGGLFQRGVSK